MAVKRVSSREFREAWERIEVQDRALLILNSSEAGTPAHDLALAAWAIRGAERTMALCDMQEQKGQKSISIEWLRAQFGPFASDEKHSA